MFFCTTDFFVFDRLVGCGVDHVYNAFMLMEEFSIVTTSTTNASLEYHSRDYKKDNCQ